MEAREPGPSRDSLPAMGGTRNTVSIAALTWAVIGTAACRDEPADRPTAAPRAAAIVTVDPSAGPTHLATQAGVSSAEATPIEVTEDDVREIGHAIRAHLEASPGPNSENLLKKNMDVVSRGPDGYRVGVWALVPKEDHVVAEYSTMLSTATMWIAQARVERENGSWVVKQVDHRRALLKPPYPGAPTR